MTSSLVSSIGCVQDDFRAYGTFGTNRAPILREGEHYLQTDTNGLPLEPCHLGVPSSASKTIFEPMLRLEQTVHLSSTYIAPTLTLSPNRPKRDST
jgi:hypothetical protein